jgi:hypothetical protein
MSVRSLWADFIVDYASICADWLIYSCVHTLVIGDSPGELSGCHNDVGNMKDYIVNCHGFEESNITVLMDDGNHVSPTRQNILLAYQKLVEESQPGDAVFCHYSGHGGKLRDDNGDEGK